MSARGFPGALPKGEVLLWRGAPDFRVLARTALHARALAIYFGLIAVYCGVSAMSQGIGPASIAMLKAVGVGAVPVGLAVVYAWATSRMAVYSITNRRVVLHIGVALPVTLNLPFARIDSADVRAGTGGSGDLSLSLTGRDRFAYVLLWPHVRPFRFSPAQPTLRGLRDVAKPAQILSRALAGVAELPVAAAISMSIPSVSEKNDTSTFPNLPQHATVTA